MLSSCVCSCVRPCPSAQLGQELQDTRALASPSGHCPQLIMLAMREEGKLSRVLNRVFTPVTHPALPGVAAPGQMSVQEIHECRGFMGLLPHKKYHIFGSPVGLSPSPLMHNTAFKWLQLPHKYTRIDTTEVDTCKRLMAAPAFGGASVTIPLKEKLLGAMHEVGHACFQFMCEYERVCECMHG